jgi:predicted Rossmann fold flavoprotein
MNSRRVVVAGGGASGFFAAISCAEAAPELEVILFEKGPQFLSKVRISGGGRCNVTHACFDPREFAAHYPRGEREMIGLLQRFQATDTVTWFESRGVKLKTERDGRMFPATDSSQTIIDCLLGAANAAGVKLRLNLGLEAVTKQPEGRFDLRLFDETTLTCDRLLLATGGCRAPAMGQVAVSFGHTLEPPLPSLFTFHIETPWLRELAGVSVETVEVAVPGTSLRERGPVLLTHWGLSGPAILRLSAWGARELHGFNYRFPLRVNWLPHLTSEALAAEFESCRKKQPARLVANSPLASLSARLWERLVRASGLPTGTRWAALSRAGRHQLTQQLSRTELPVTGKSLNKDEFVTCGGVRLSEVNLKTMESRLCSGLYFAGELLDIDGLTGGFNFQAAWTTGWIGGVALARRP